MNGAWPRFDLNYVNKVDKMKNIKTIFILILAFACLATYVQAAKMMGDDLSNMIIEGENRLKVHPTGPTLNWQVDPYQNMTQLFDDKSIMGQLQPKSIQEPPVKLPRRRVSNKTARPWHRDVYDQPVFNSYHKNKKRKKK